MMLLPKKTSRGWCSYQFATTGMLGFWLASCCLQTSAQTPWVKPPVATQKAEIPGLVHAVFHSTVMHESLGFCVVLPPSYHDSEHRYPVIYWLHGGGGSESSSLFTARTWQKLYEEKRAREVILVYPNGFRSGYMDHADGKIMIESWIIRELIPHIDSVYRTIPNRAGRAAHGFSMGASGAFKFAIKYPQLFCSAVAYGGGAIDLENSQSKFILDILERNLKSDPKLVRENNTYYHLERTQEILRKQGTKFLLVCGADDSWHRSAVDFQRVLLQHDLDCQLQSVPGIGHRLRELYEKTGRAAALFQERVFARTLADE